jgi:hypothetical protein
MRVFAVSTIVLLSSLLCSCTTVETVKTETVWKDTLITFDRPAIIDTVELHPVTHVGDGPPVTPDTCVISGEGKSGIRVRVVARDGKQVAEVSVPADTSKKAVKLTGTLIETTRKNLSWIEQMIDDLPPWAIIVALVLSASTLIYMLKK